MTLFWQWREHWAGQEMLHGTCVSATGRWRPNKESWAWISRTHAEHGGWLLANPPMQARVGLLMTCESAWSFGIDPTDDGMDYASRFRDDWHGSLCRAQIWRDVVPEDADFAPYKVLALPMMPIVSESTRVRLKEWVRSGGTLLLGPLTGWRSEEYTAFTDREFGGFEELMGATSALRFTVQWVEDRVQIVFADGHKTRTKTMCDGYECHGAEVLARYEGGYGDSLPAVISNRFGKGRVITSGGMVDADTWTRLMLEACREHGIGPMAKAGGRVVVVPRANAAGEVVGHGVANLSDQMQSVTLARGGVDLLTGQRVDATFTALPFQPMVIRH